MKTAPEIRLSERIQTSKPVYAHRAYIGGRMCLPGPLFIGSDCLSDIIHASGLHRCGIPPQYPDLP